MRSVAARCGSWGGERLALVGNVQIAVDQGHQWEHVVPLLSSDGHTGNEVRMGDLAQPTSACPSSCNEQQLSLIL